MLHCLCVGAKSLMDVAQQVVIVNQPSACFLVQIFQLSQKILEFICTALQIPGEVALQPLKTLF